MSRDVFSLLKGVDLFSELDEAQIKLISQVVTVRRFQKDEDIILEGEDGSAGFFVIGEGESQVYLHSSDGRETILSLLGPGDFFGEMSLIDDEPRSASVKSVTQSTVYQIRRQEFLNQLQRFPELTMALMQQMSRRLRKANRQISSLATLTVYGRIAGTILNLVEDRGTRIHTENGKTAIVIRNRPTHQQIAEMSGTTRETVSRILTSLKNKGAISVTPKELFILSEEVLRHGEDD